MPNNYLNKLSEKYSIPLKTLESVWKEAKKATGEKSEKKMKWGLVVKIFKNMINKRYELNESADIDRFVNIKLLYEKSIF